MDPLEALAKQTEQVSESLIRHFEGMPEDRREWRPSDAGRSALDQLKECAILNGWAAEVLGGFGVAATDWSAEGAKLDSAETVLAALRANTKKLAGSIRDLPSDRFGDSVKLPWSEEPTTLLDCTFIGSWNSTYHLGQIAYIQTLYGDQGYY